MEKNVWQLDPAHSEIQFKVKHLMITTVTGYFRNFNVEVVTAGEDFSGVENLKFSADVSSIDTNNAQRDEHLRSPEFFDADQYPLVLFSASGYDHGEGQLTGTLEVRGITNPVRLDVEFGGIVVDGYGQTKAGFTISGKISRKEFGLTWGAVTEAGNVVVGDEVRFHGEIQLIKQV